MIISLHHLRQGSGTICDRNGEPAKHSGPHRLLNIFSEPYLLLIFKFYFENTQYYVANLLNIRGELFL